MPGSRIFNRNKALGFVSNHVPASVRYFHKRKENVIVTCIGKSINTYTSSFRLICTTPLHEDEISCIATDPFLVHVAAGQNIYSWRSSRVIKKTFRGKAVVHLLLAFGAHLIAVDEANVLTVWDIRSEEAYLEIPFEASFKVSCIMHPPSYLNKILLGSDQGGLQLWNIKKGNLVYSFKAFDGKVTHLAEAPASDIAAIGLQNGKIVLLNLKLDEILMEFQQECGAVTGISFRTDGHPLMATGSTSGRINLWNLEKRRLIHILDAHAGPVNTLKCFPDEPLMFSASADNSIKLWIFDMPDGGPRLLRRREGHAEAPLCIRYHGAGGRHIVTSAEDSTLRIFNTVSESLNRSMGRATYNKKASKKRRAAAEALKMPPVVYFTTETTREKEWDNIAAIHKDYQTVTTWSFDRCTMGDLRLTPDNLKEKVRQNFSAKATSLCLTQCGNFVLIGYSCGNAYRFNIQSGIFREQYGKPAHDSQVKGVAVDNLNQVVMTGGQSGIIKFWPFKSPSDALRSIELGERISFFRIHRESSLLCVALDDFSVCLVDCDTKNVARKFQGHKAQITDACFSPDGRWLITSAMDAVVKIFDIPSSYLIDHFRVDSPVISMTMSPTADFLATAHVDYLGVNLWANKTLFNHISLRALRPDSEPVKMTYPVSAVEVKDDSDPSDDDYEEDEIQEYTSPAQVSLELISFSDLALSRWMNLLNLDVCKRRNKPKVPVQQAKQAPFFLPTVAGLDLKFDLSAAQANVDDSGQIIAAHVVNVTTFGRLLKTTIATDKYDDCVDKLLTMNVSAIDFEIKALAPIGGGSIGLMQQFMKLLVHMLQSNLYFEMAQSYLGVFLKSHSDIIVENSELADLLEDVEAAQIKGWKQLDERFLYGIGVVNSLRNYAS